MFQCENNAVGLWQIGRSESARNRRFVERKSDT
jgi:hypothetical protein